MAELGAYKENVKFSDADAEALISASNNAASKIDGQAGSRQTWRTTGSTDFQGYFSQVFASNGTTQISDSGELSAALRKLATYAGSSQFGV